MVMTESRAQKALTTPRAIQRPTRKEVLDAIVREAHCSRQKAGQLLSVLRSAVENLRSDKCRTVFHLTNNQIRSIHDQYAAVMPDDASPVPGSAHALINQYLLRGAEVSLMHRQRGKVIKNCTVEVELLRVG